jgi:hypothetical protein
LLKKPFLHDGTVTARRKSPIQTTVADRKRAQLLRRKPNEFQASVRPGGNQA